MTHQTPTAQYLTFRAAGEVFAAPILRVKEIIRYEPATRVPSMPPAIRGVINLRGNIVPIMDLSLRFRSGESPVNKRSCYVIVEITWAGEKKLLGLLADAVNQVIEVDETHVESAPELGLGIKNEFLAGIARVDNSFAMVLDIERVGSLNDLLASDTTEPPRAQNV